MAATGICRNSVDTAGGALISSQSSVIANGSNVIVNGNSVTPHGDAPHSSAVMIAGSNNVFVGGIMLETQPLVVILHLGVVMLMLEINR